MLLCATWGIRPDNVMLILSVSAIDLFSLYVLYLLGPLKPCLRLFVLHGLQPLSQHPYRLKCTSVRCLHSYCGKTFNWPKTMS